MQSFESRNFSIFLIHVRFFCLLIISSVLLPLSLPLPRAHAGLFEIGASGSYKRSNIAVDAYDESSSLTGSLAYILTESSAIEASYTDGSNKRVISETVPNGHVTYLYYKTVGLDFIYTFGSKDKVLRPYVKGGANYIISKRIVDQYRLANGTLWPATTLDDQPGLVPTVGLGFRFGLTESISLKVGVDGWTSRPLNSPPVTIDWIGRAGLSWFF